MGSSNIGVFYKIRKKLWKLHPDPYKPSSSPPSSMTFPGFNLSPPPAAGRLNRLPSGKDYHFTFQSAENNMLAGWNVLSDLRALMLVFPPHLNIITWNLHSPSSSAFRWQQGHCHQSGPFYQIVGHIQRTKLRRPARGVAHGISCRLVGQFPFASAPLGAACRFWGRHGFIILIFR
jgi:hypothetical protein